MKSKKPVWLIILILFTVLRGLGGTFGAVVILSGANNTPNSLLAFGFIFFVISVFFVYLAFSLWTIKKSSLKLAKQLYSAYIVLGVISIFPLFPNAVFSMSNVITQLVGIALSAVIIYYLSLSKIKNLYASNT
ncbi:hypothetical protein [uncultured Paraglaciecola sp.]|uniref:hypothetical protein n=1 Tax=uncultured Paraglaciecola sp. TaxID=1765024 RepID=UPI002596B0F1|nr:hypothetical protein [uncultured Paraglaciecola sp.]